MIVDAKPVKTKSKLGSFVRAVGLIIFILVLNVPAFLIVLGSLGSSSTTLLSPLPEGGQTALTNPSTPTPPSTPIAQAAPSPAPTAAPLIAAPQDPSTVSAATAADSNSRQGTATILAGQNQVTVANPIISADSYIYIVPKTPAAVFLKSKDVGAFTVEAVASPAADLVLDYWIVNQ